VLKIKCDMCNKELKELGALLFSPPKGNDVKKYHICVKCFKRIMED
jgi:hypothetical protein